MNYISYTQLCVDSSTLAQLISEYSFYSAVFAIPMGGILPAYIVSEFLGIPLIGEPELYHGDFYDVVGIVDYISSGDSINENFQNIPIGSVYKMNFELPVNKNPYFYVHELNDKPVLPYSGADFTQVERNELIT